jgi:hypothetical protein
LQFGNLIAEGDSVRTRQICEVFMSNARSTSVLLALLLLSTSVSTARAVDDDKSYLPPTALQGKSSDGAARTGSPEPRAGAAAAVAPSRGVRVVRQQPVYRNRYAYRQPAPFFPFFRFFN